VNQLFNFLFFGLIDKHLSNLTGSLLIEMGVIVQPFGIEPADSGREFVEIL
jgi:hypothetical protein